MKWLPWLCAAGSIGIGLVHAASGCVSHSCEDLATCETPGTGGSGAGTNTGGAGASGGGAVGGSGTGTGTGTGTGSGGGFAQEPTLGLGQSHTCSTTESGGAKCWGANGSGQLGNDSTTSSTVPVDVVSLQAPIVQVDGGSGFTCFLLSDGTVWCVGRNDLGQLGNGGTSMSTVPVQVQGITTASAIWVDYDRACAVLANDTAKCWGNRGTTNSLLGDAQTGGVATVPVDVQQTGIAEFALGSGHTCARLTNGQVRCWGQNGVGQMGNGSANSIVYDYPVLVNIIDDAQAIAATLSENCVVRMSGELWCWSKLYGNDPQPVVASLTDVAEIEGGFTGFCARLADGSAWCFGGENLGSFGNGPEDHFDFFSAVQVLGLNDLTQLAMSADHTCAMTSSNTAWCWGSNAGGQLGDGTMTDADQPAQVQGL